MLKLVRQKASKASRQRERRKLGALSLQIVAPKTLTRYRTHVYKFLDFLVSLGASYPSSFMQLDEFVCQYIDYLWESGDSKSWAGDCLSGLGHFIPACKPWLVGGWRLHAAWGRAELPSRALPFTELMLYALAQLAAENAWWDTAVLLILGFHVFPRSAELFSARKVDFVFDSRRQAVWSLPLTKSGQRVGAKESLIVEDAWIVDLLKQFLHPLMAWDRLSTVSAQGQRQRLKRLLKAASLEGDYRWYSCRRGGATAVYRATGNMSRVCHIGRWNSQKTAQIYITDALASLVETQLTERHRHRLHRLANLARPNLQL